jgi:hypothetical protein
MRVDVPVVTAAVTASAGRICAAQGSRVMNRTFVAAATNSASQSHSYGQYQFIHFFEY